MRSAAALLLITFLAACGDSVNDDRVPQDSLGPANAEPPTVADSADLGPRDDDPIARWAARLPEGSLRRDGACPFECCVYREWTADSGIELRTEPTAGSTAIGQLEPGTKFDADSGFVRITGVALVAVTDTVTPMIGRSLAPGDTLVLLDYVGEGFYSAWMEGEVVELADFWSDATDRPRGRVLGERSTEWWVQATTAEVSGWFRADAPGIQLSGADACG